MQRKILVLDAHPVSKTLNAHLAHSYASAATAAGHDVRQMGLSDMTFDPDFGQTHYRNAKPLEPDLELFMTALEQADHFVMTVPMWWGGMPARSKAFFDRALLVGRAFDTRTPNFLGLPAPMLTGKTARVMITSDTPRFFQRLAYGDAYQKQIKNQILGFVGIKPARFTWFGGAGQPKPGAVEKWVSKAAKLGRLGQ